jgi:hypothetical protein
MTLPVGVPSQLEVSFHTYPRAAAAAIALKFHPKHEKQKQNETNYENITH